jgi:glycosyltransferase involved in cell wall biosynthesis
VKPSFAVIIPMFNEQSGAVKCIAEISHALKQINAISKIIVINDGSSDRTSEILNSILGQNENLCVLTHLQNQGYGSALKTGIKKANELGLTYVLFMDSDLTNQPTDIFHFYKKMESHADVIKATRYSDGGKVVGVQFKRRIISRVGNIVSRALFRLPITDPTNGFRALRTSMVNSFDYKEKGFALIMEELYLLARMKLSCENVPVTLRNRNTQGRESSFLYTPSQIFNYLKYPLMAFFGIYRSLNCELSKIEK